jgi:hypothetical protein
LPSEDTTPPVTKMNLVERASDIQKMILSESVRRRAARGSSWARTQDDALAGGKGESEDAEPAKVIALIRWCRDFERVI